MWTCEKCKRKFRNENQAHSCAVVSIDSHFEKKQPEVRLAYNKVIGEVKKLGKVNISAVQNGILVSSTSNFLSLKPKTKHLEIEFLLDEELNEFPIYKTFRLSKKRVAHYVKVDSELDVDSHLVSLIHRSFAACSK